MTDPTTLREALHQIVYHSIGSLDLSSSNIDAIVDDLAPKLADALPDVVGRAYDDIGGNTVVWQDPCETLAAALRDGSEG